MLGLERLGAKVFCPAFTNGELACPPFHEAGPIQLSRSGRLGPCLVGLTFGLEDLLAVRGDGHSMLHVSNLPKAMRTRYPTSTCRPYSQTKQCVDRLETGAVACARRLNRR